MSVESIITENLDVWTSAIKTKSASGRGSSKKLELYGIKKLRELILELAVRGKLVSQEQSVEKNDSFLNRLNAKSLCSGSQSKLIVPTGWAIFKIKDLVSKLGSGSTPRGGKSAYVESGIPFLRSQNVWNDGVKLDDVVYISDEVHEKMSKTKVFPGDILLNITGASLGRTTVFPEFLKEANVSQHVTIVRMCESELTNWVHLVLMSPLIQKEIWDRQVGMAIEGLSKRTFETFEIPIPPLNEQARIVEKVRELMSLCDQLESQTEASIDAHQTLVKSLLETLTNAKDADELNESWQRISAHFDVLFTTEESIDQLKQTILQLAVMGKLVKQDPNDEPASQLLERIAAEKEQLIKDKKIKKQKPLPPIKNNELLYKIPSSWSFSYLQDLCSLITDGTHQTPKYTDSGRPFVSAQFVKPFCFMPEKCRFVSEENYQGYIKNRKPELGDILLSRVGAGIGEAAVIDRDIEFAIYVSTGLLKPFKNAISPFYLEVWLNSPIGREFSERNTLGKGVSQGNLNLSLIRQFIIGLPPIAEQKKIVEHVRSLTRLCDHLISKLEESQSIQNRIADAFLTQ